MAKKNLKKGKQEEVIDLGSQLTKAEAFFEKNGKLIVGVIILIILVAIGLWFMRSCNADKEHDAQNAISLSQKAFESGQYEEALNGNKSTSIGFLKVMDEYSGTKTANLAKLYAAICYFELGKTDEAVKQLQGYENAGDNTISPTATEMLGNLMVAKGDKAGGAAKLEEAARSADNESLSPIFLRQAAIIYENLKQPEKALELYKEIKSKYPQCPLCQGESNGSLIDTYIERVSK